MPGPLPDPMARRRNAPTIPTTRLPASGFRGDVPPSPYELGAAGAAWYAWAWRTPQAAAWDAGSLYAVARRAHLEDDVAALFFTDHLDLDDLLAGADREAVRRVEFALSTLKRSASGKLGIEKEMRELDAKLGLTPESLAKLRWAIVADEEPVEAAKPKVAKPRTSSHLRAVDPALIGE